MIDLLFICIASLTLIFLAICILAVYDIYCENRHKKQKKKEFEEWQRRLP